MTFVLGQQTPYRWRRLTPLQEEAVVAQHEAGASLTQLARQYGVHVRTICRTLHRVQRSVHVVRCGDYVASFEVREDYGPTQLTPWAPAA